MSSVLKNPYDGEPVLQHGISKMYFFAASTNAINEVYGSGKTVLYPPYYGDLDLNDSAFIELVDTVYSYPHPLCFTWARFASQAYEGLVGYKDVWEWPEAMMTYGTDYWHLDRAVRLEVPRHSEVVGPTYGDRPVVHSFRIPVGRAPEIWNSRATIDVVAQGRRICVLSLLEANLFAAYTVRYEQMTECLGPTVELMRGTLVVHASEFLELVKRIMSASGDYLYEWALTAVDIANAIEGSERDWSIITTGIHRNIVNASSEFEFIHGRGLVQHLQLPRRPDPWIPPRFVDSRRWELHPPQT